MVEKDLTQASLNDIADDYYENQMPDMHIENICQEYEAKWLLDTIKPGARIVDLGFGDGIVAPILADGFNLTLIEGSAKLVDRARKVLPKSVEVIHTLFEDFAPTEAFDAVIASHVLEHVEDPGGLLCQIAKWLKPEGKIIVIVPNKESIHRKLALEMNLIGKLDELSPRDHLVGHLRVYSLATLTEILESSGLNVIDQRGFFLKPLSNGQMLEWSHPLIRALNEIAAGTPPDLCANLGLVCTLK